ncbi:unnamed protein product, partial [Onchocerca ochengi]|uniref:FMRFamide-like neuropeptides 14 n=1 Tax=Onchocerca ochengi TaxID=42157 RepID=A0A182EWN7_ONCOC
MLTIAFQSMIYLVATLACITFTHVESLGIRTLESEYDIAPAERKNENMMDYFVRIGRGSEKPGHIFGRIARTE